MPSYNSVMLWHNLCNPCQVPIQSCFGTRAKQLIPLPIMPNLGSMGNKYINQYLHTDSSPNHNPYMTTLKLVVMILTRNLCAYVLFHLASHSTQFCAIKHEPITKLLFCHDPPINFKNSLRIRVLVLQNLPQFSLLKLMIPMSTPDPSQNTSRW